MSKNKSKINLLLIGPLPPPIGGVRVLFKQLVEELQEYSDLSIEVINLKARKSFKGKLIIFVKTIYKLIRMIKNQDTVAFHGTTKGVIYLGPFIYVISRLFNKKIIFRKFGGVFHKKYEKQNRAIQWLLNKSVFKADLWLFETKELVSYFEEKCKREVGWYPNNRKMVKKRNLSERADKFVFVSQIRKDKGVKQTFEVSNKLPEDIQIDIYGNLGYDISKNEISKLDKNYSAQFRGKLAPDKVIPTLKGYDVLLLPTFHEGEGYPGVILEAYACGLPVVSTRWAAVPEIVDESSGVLIKPNSKKELIEVIIKIYKNEQLFNKLQKGAIKKAKKFDAQKWTRKFADLCRDL